MGFSPSEKTKLLKEIKNLKDELDEVNKRQDSELQTINKRLARAEQILADLVLKSQAETKTDAKVKPKAKAD